MKFVIGEKFSQTSIRSPYGETEMELGTPAMESKRARPLPTELHKLRDDRYRYNIFYLTYNLCSYYNNNKLGYFYDNPIGYLSVRC